MGCPRQTNSGRLRHLCADDQFAQHLSSAGVIVGYETCDAHTGVAADDVHGAEVDAGVFQADCDLRQRARFVFEADEQR